MKKISLQDESRLAREAADSYHERLSERYSQELRAGFEATMTRCHLDYGGRPLCPYLRPHFLTRGQFEFLQSEMQALLTAFRLLGRLAVSSPELQASMDLTDDEKELVALPPGYDNPTALSRLDSFLTDEGLNLVEFNAECPTGVGYNERLFQAFMQFPVMQEFSRGRVLCATDGVAHVLQALLRAWREFGGKHPPQIAIVDWPHVVTRGEFEIFQEYFEARGYATRIVDPRELEWNGRTLQQGDFRVDIVYRRLLISEFLQQRADCSAFEAAYRAQGACFVNNFRTKVLHKKLVFAAVREEGFLKLLDSGVREVVLRTVPWTAKVRPGKVYRDGQSVDLETFAAAQQQRLVLKPNDDYGGRGIALGWQLSASDWQAALQAAMSTCQDPQQSWALQEAVDLWQEPFPDLEGAIAPRYVDLDPFIFTDYFYGFLTRLSNAAISNVTAGAGQAPTFVLG